MIPLMLEASQFMAYESLSLDFTGFQIACLSGQNGAGKSTILDALTWVLFEASRAARPEDVIRLGAQETQVSLTFSLENKTYRVLRSRQRPRGRSSGKHSLEFQILSETGFRSLTGKGVRETQERIIETLHMDYSLFIHSSFILQGRADAFTTSSPRARKEVLADILNLKQYAQLQERAKEHKSRLQQEKQHLQGQLEQLEALLNSAPWIQEQLTSLREAAQQLQAQLNQTQQQLNALRQTLNILQTQETKLRLQENRWLQLQHEQKQLQQELETNQQELQRLQKLEAQRSQIEAGYAHLQECQERQQTLETQWENYLLAQDELRRWQQEWQSAQHQIQLALSQKQQELKYQTQEIQRRQELLQRREQIQAEREQWLQLKAELAQQDARQQAAQALNQRVADCELQLQRLRDRHSSARQQLNSQRQVLQEQIAGRPALEARRLQEQEALAQFERLQAELESVIQLGQTQSQNAQLARQDLARLQERQQEVATRLADLQTHEAGACPLCERQLTSEDRALLLEKYAQEARTLTQQAEQLEQRAQAAEAEAQRQRQYYTHLNRKLKQRDVLQQQLGQTEQALSHLQDLEQQLQQLENQWQALQSTQAKDPELARLEHTLAKLRAEQAQQSYDPRQHQALQVRFRESQSAEQAWLSLTQAENELVQLLPQQAQLRQTIADLEARLSHQDFNPQLQARIQTREAELAAQAALGDALKQAREETKRLKIYQQKWEALNQSAQALKQSEKEEQRLKQQLAEREAEAKQLQAALSGLSELRNRLTRQETELKTLQNEEQELLKQDRDLHARIYALSQESEQLAEQTRLRDQTRQKQAKVEQELRLYTELSEIFGPKGIQAVVIENAIPEIEYAANELLAQMTEGRMHVKFQTLKTVKSSNALEETLDIFISDEMGTRSYETFSTGESFRVNFAIRLAISRMLARRAGAKLQTLVIDEGFGSQDSQGKTRLVEAINSVAHLYACILVITHVDDLKALFPCRIDVQKGEQGAKLTVVK